MPRASLVTLAVASFIIACDRAPTSPRTAAERAGGTGALFAKGDDGPSVTGSGTITFGASVERVSVDVQGFSGRARFHDKTASGTVNGTIEINCVRYLGNEATLSGIVTHSNRKELEGFEALFQIRDNGEASGKGPGPDFMSPVLFHEVGIGPNCQVPSEFDLAPVDGDFTVVPPEAGE
jgi:hypothetical protein